MDTTKYRSKLDDLKHELAARVERTHRHIYEKDEPVSAEYSEQSVEMENQQLVYALDAEGKLLLKRIDKALMRIEKGGFGFCEECGESIAEGRLAAVPYAELCINCANKE